MNIKLDDDEIKFINERWDRANFFKSTLIPEEIKSDYIEYVRPVFKSCSSYSDAIMDFRIALYLSNKTKLEVVEIKSYIKNLNTSVTKKLTLLFIAVIFSIFISFCFGFGSYFYGKSIGIDIGKSEGCTIPAPRRIY